MIIKDVKDLLAKVDKMGESYMESNVLLATIAVCIDNQNDILKRQNELLGRHNELLSEQNMILRSHK
jgi:hypothetical protein